MKLIMDEIGELYRLKENTVGPTKCYLGANTKILQMKSGIECWTMSSDSYIFEGIANVKILLEEDERKRSKPKISFWN